MGDTTLPPLFKIVGEHGEPLNGGSGDWSLPRQAGDPCRRCAGTGAGPIAHVACGMCDGSGREPRDVPGEWREIAGPLEACRNGLHLTDASNLRRWLPASRWPPEPYRVYRAEADGECKDAGEKWVARRVRLVGRPLPVPDLNAIEQAYQDVIGVADAMRRQAQNAAEAAFIAVVGGIGGYLERIGETERKRLARELPEGSAIRQAIERYAAAAAVRDAAWSAAAAVYAETCRDAEAIRRIDTERAMAAFAS